MKTKTKVLYLHGLEGKGTKGTKALYLLNHPDYEVNALPMDTKAAAALVKDNPRPAGSEEFMETVAGAVSTAYHRAAWFKPDIIVGSSFGAGVAMRLANLELYNGPMVLLAPAGAKLFGVEDLPGPNRVAVIHSSTDKVVPIEDSLRLIEHTEGESALFLVNDDHRLHSAVEDKDGVSTLSVAIEWATAGA